MRIILTGTYSSKNKGDAAMQMALVQSLKESIPNCYVTLSSPFYEIDREYYTDAEVIKSSRRMLIYSTFIIVYLLLRRLLKRIFHKYNLLPFNKEVRSISEADLVIDLSGDMITEDYGLHVSYSHYLPILFALLLKKRVFICAQSVGPFKYTKRLARWLFNHASFITLRDYISYDYLKELGVCNKNIRVTSDVSFLLRPDSHNVNHLNRFVETVHLKNKRILGVSLSSIVSSAFNDNPLSRVASFELYFAQLLDHLISINNYEILFVPHVFGPSDKKDDRLVLRSVRDKMIESKHSLLLEQEYPSDKLKSIISHCDLFIGARMHANMAALASCIPVIALSYSHKSEGIMALFHQEQFVIPIEELNVDRLLTKVGIIEDNYEQVITTLNKTITLVIEESQYNIVIIKELLKHTNNCIS